MVSLLLPEGMKVQRRVGTVPTRLRGGTVGPKFIRNERSGRLVVMVAPSVSGGIARRADTADRDEHDIA